MDCCHFSGFIPCMGGNMIILWIAIGIFILLVIFTIGYLFAYGDNNE
jgi:hypothetical protein